MRVNLKASERYGDKESDDINVNILLEVTRLSTFEGILIEYIVGVFIGQSHTRTIMLAQNDSLWAGEVRRMVFYCQSFSISLFPPQNNT